MNIIQKLDDVSQKLSAAAETLDDVEFTRPLDELEQVAQKCGKAWSGSWLGYHANVYYENFDVPPPGAHFSQEWGLQEVYFQGSTGDWREYSPSDVINSIERTAGKPDLKRQEKEASRAVDIFEDAKSGVLSALSIAIKDQPDDKFLSDLHSQVDNIEILDSSTIINRIRPKGHVITRDLTALGQGVISPPHISVIVRVATLRMPFQACRELSKIASRIASHLNTQQKRVARDSRIGTNVFIGHGRSLLWRDLKDFLQERLHLPWDEFNRVPIAGVTNIARLSQMLDESAIAFLVMTAEDEQRDGRLHARMNVIHEAGLFQGRLGFERAIILLEEGCEEFSNVQGLGQIRFPKGDIRAIFEDIRQVLEREGLVALPGAGA